MITWLSYRHIRSVQNPPFVELIHNLPPSGDFYVVQFFLGPALPEFVVVSRSGVIKFSQSLLKQGAAYKLIAMQVSNGIADSVWWHDSYVFDAATINIEFTSQGASTGTGELRSFSGRTTVNKAPVSRTVFAVGVDGDEPVFLARTQSDNNGLYTLEWRGYAGHVVITAVDDYGVPFNSGDARGTGERVHPPAPNGYVYQVASPGQLGAEPQWPAEAGAQVVSGSCVLVALPYYRPKSAGPVVVG